MDGDVEVDIEPTDADNDMTIAAENGGNLVVGGSAAGGAGVSVAGLDLSTVGSHHSNSQPRSRDPSFEAAEVCMAYLYYIMYCTEVCI